mmetsp:Transcript_17333/g.50378  ORF Transcript_17333/g.50378 Transcript_17333/m.50378 type:complete len:418 (+) Transcript_17333:686-1939(+)
MHRLPPQAGIDQFPPNLPVPTPIGGQFYGDLFVVVEAAVRVQSLQPQHCISGSGYPRGHVGTVGAGDDGDSTVQRVLRDRVTVVRVRIEHGRTKVHRSHLMIERVGLPRKEMYAVVHLRGGEIAADAGVVFLARLRDETAEVGHALDGILQQAEHRIGNVPQYTQPAAEGIRIVLEKFVKIAKYERGLGGTHPVRGHASILDGTSRPQLVRSLGPFIAVRRILHLLLHGVSLGKEMIGHVDEIFHVQIIRQRGRAGDLVRDYIIDVLRPGRAQKLLMENLYRSRTEREQSLGPFALTGVPVPLDQYVYPLVLHVPRHLDVLVLEMTNVVETIGVGPDPFAPIHAPHGVLDEILVIGLARAEHVYLELVRVEESEHIVTQIQYRLGVESRGEKSDLDPKTRRPRFRDESCLIVIGLIQ